MRRYTSHTAVHRPHTGFTIVELMMVVMIIAILVALILPAINSAVTKAREATVISEIKGLANGAQEFKSTYGHYPPSYIVLSETGAWPQESRNVLQKIFGREFNFSKRRDLNGNNTIDADPIILRGSECLVFFLGGVPQRSPNGQWTLTGFSPNKTDPFAPAAPGARNRVQYFKDFDVNRLDDDDNDGFPDYHDIFNMQGGGRPYVYLSTTATGIYNANRDAAGTGLLYAYNQGNVNNPWKKDGIQIISPGRDHTFGPGGAYTLDDGGSLLVGARDPERDNLTSFSGYRLAK